MHDSDEEDFSKITKTRVKAFSVQNSTNRTKCKKSHFIYASKFSVLMEI